MKKYTIGLIIMLLALLSLIGCGRDEKTDYSEYTFFTDIDWCRETEIDVEHICFFFGWQFQLLLWMWESCE